MFEVLYGLSAILLISNFIAIFHIKEVKANNLRIAKKLSQMTKLSEDKLKEIDKLKMDKLDVKTELGKTLLTLEKLKKESIPDDATEQNIQELSHDLKTHGFMLMRVNPDKVFLRN